MASGLSGNDVLVCLEPMRSYQLAAVGFPYSRTQTDKMTLEIMGT